MTLTEAGICLGVASVLGIPHDYWLILALLPVLTMGMLLGLLAVLIVAHVIYNLVTGVFRREPT